ncbi:uncharacterized protein KGF55_002734 [Candida pseudojiufengensis]|uniref:uncharacterized protein n=1 Tax=Candida pseudojiufengensis TaxID=497109 RepID=UPI0022248C41|nr:uncharacterized protein KGF55_002734 [Candida pseudojiufengensis]KAI5962942.1 hypothetical protein KGF55_002734 [Candida pseudojiufengensis]
MIEAIYISDITNSLIYEYSNKLSIPKFKTILPKIQSQSTDSTSPQSLTTTHFNINSSYYIVQHKHLSLNFYTLCSNSNSSPLIPHTFIQRFIETLQDYFGELNSNKIETNNDIITLILYQMLDDGMPNITDFNKIRDLVSHNSLLTKILNEASKTTGLVQDTKLSFQTDIPWRRNEVKHTNNEMYVDVIENLNLIIKPIIKKSKLNQQYDSAFYSSHQSESIVDNYILNGSINGQIDFISKLSGQPTLELILNKIGSNLILPQFHRCINLDMFKERKGVLSFIPPDGKSTIMKYQIDLNDESMNNKEKINLIKLNSIDTQFLIHENSSDFEIKLFPTLLINKIDSIIVEIVCENQEDQIKINRISHGDFQTKFNNKHEWSMKDLKKGVIPILNATIISKNEEEIESNGDSENHKDSLSTHSIKSKKPLYIKLNFTYKGLVPSGNKVESLKITNAKGLGDNVKPYKGVKYITNSGEYIVRS